MGRIGKSVVVAVVLVSIALAPGCTHDDPAGEVLKARRLWKVDLVGFVEREGGAISAQFRLSGPVYSPLTYLTVRIELLDESGDAAEIWAMLRFARHAEGYRWNDSHHSRSRR